MKFKKIGYGTKIDDLESMGFYEGDHVIVLFDNGDILHGTLNYITEYSTLFDIQLVLDNTYYKTRDMVSAVGITKVEFE